MEHCLTIFTVYLDVMIFLLVLLQYEYYNSVYVNTKAR